MRSYPCTSKYSRRELQGLSLKIASRTQRVVILFSSLIRDASGFPYLVLFYFIPSLALTIKFSEPFASSKVLQQLIYPQSARTCSYTLLLGLSSDF